MDEFKVGDIVMLKSGGPRMTISQVAQDTNEEQRAWCDWFEGNKPHKGDFLVAQLKHIEEGSGGGFISRG
jgi:uncharacterized protein YodC (DUF2158 family)